MSDFRRSYMRGWIREHYEDPEALEKLNSEFSFLIPEVELKDIEDELKLYRELAFYDDLLAKDIASISDYYHNFCGAILDIEKLFKTKVDDSVDLCFFRLLYVNVITALETYLSDVFIGMVKKNSDLMRRFIETTPEFKDEKLSLSDAFMATDKAEKKADNYLMGLVWHRIERVKLMYKDTLGIDFPEDISAIFRAIDTRHDIVHRNGRTKEGIEIIITENDISEIINSIKTCVQSIDTELAKLQLNTHIPDKNDGI